MVARRQAWLRIASSILFMLLGACMVLTAAIAIYVRSRPPLSIWHETVLEGEFTASSNIDSLEAYLALEDKLFERLNAEIDSRLPPEERTEFNRFNPGSRSDPARWSPNWNRTFELRRADASFGALLLHGYSDSPYSLRSIGETLHDDGGDVLGLRIPGHGTAPSALRMTTIEDMAAAVRLAMAHLRNELGNKPIVIVGYSNGAALALNHTFEAIEDAGVPRPAALVLISPEIAIAPVAALASWQAWLGELLGLAELAWTSVEPEYDPFKYNSFAVNAGEQAYRITSIIGEQLSRLATTGRLREIPPILAFQSAVDATVTAAALKRELFDRRDSTEDELVVFDVNDRFELEGLIDRPLDLGGMLNGPTHNYSVSIVTNRDNRNPAAVVRERPSNSQAVTTSDLGIDWPHDVYSLSHIALPFPPEDPLYGIGPAGHPHHLSLGNVMLRGETGTLRIPVAAMTRQHWNPFYSYLERRVRAFLSRTVTEGVRTGQYWPEG